METITKVVLSGSMFTLTEAHLADWPSEVPVNAALNMTISGVAGVGTKASDTQIQLMMAESIVAPQGSCVEYTWTTSKDCAPSDDTTTCTSTAIPTLTPETKLAVLDENGCPTMTVTLAQILAYVTENATPPSLCDMITARPTAPTAGMEIIALQGDCTLAALPIDALACTMTDPEPFTCE